MACNLIAFAGYAGAGKDEAAVPLIANGYARHCFGDIIKRQLDEVVMRHFGFSAFTDNRQEKGRIRRTLESWGEDNYDAILEEFMASLPEKAVNTRLVRVQEAKRWKQRGGIIMCIQRFRCQPATGWEKDRMDELEYGGLIDYTIQNNETVADLHAKVLKFT